MTCEGGGIVKRENGLLKTKNSPYIHEIKRERV